MPYTPDATVVTQPDTGVKAATMALEFQTLKLYMRDVLLAGLAGKLPIAGGTLSGPLIGTSGSFSGQVSANNFVGSGAGLTNLPAVAPTSGQIIAALGFTPYNAANPAGYLAGITGGNVTAALGYTPYNSSNPAGYLSSITSLQVTTALGYTPLSTVSNAAVIAALGYTPYSNANPNGYINGINSSMIAAALGYTPANSASSFTLLVVTGAAGVVPYPTYHFSRTGSQLRIDITPANDGGA
jgi:hypothetical protein